MSGRRRFLTVIGARPQFVKAAALQRAFDALPAALGVEQLLVHTGQHYDPGMSDVFFQELGLRPPTRHLGVGSGGHGAQTGAILGRLEPVLTELLPDAVIVHGDTNSTLAGALAAAKLGVPVAHVEAGLRSFDRSMPEELNRVLVDHASTWLFCPTRRAADQLSREGITTGVHLVGDVMLDTFEAEFARAQESSAPAELGLTAGGYALVTIHRAGTTDDPPRLRATLEALEHLARSMPVVMPVHPRTRAALERADAHFERVRALSPAPYRTFLGLLAGARAVITDSGGVQKEAYWAGVPCVTVRDSTEWPETVEEGWNVLTEPTPGALAAALDGLRPDPSRPRRAFGAPGAARRMVALLTGAG